MWRATFDPRRHLDQHAVADLMAERVVDFLETVKIKPEQRQLALGAHMAQPVDEMIIQPRAVKQAGHDVGSCQKLHLVGQPLTGFSRGNRIAQHLEHVHRDRHHRWQQQHDREGQHFQRHFRAQQQRNANRHQRQDHLADGDGRPARVARRDTDRIADGVGHHQRHRHGGAVMAHGEHGNHADHGGIAIGAKFVNQLQRARIAARGAAQMHRQPHPDDRYEAENNR